MKYETSLVIRCDYSAVSGKGSVNLILPSGVFPSFNEIQSLVEIKTHEKVDITYMEWTYKGE